MAVVRFQLVAFQLQQSIPAVAFGNRRRLIERRLRLFIGHLQKQQKRQLLDVIAVRQPVITQDVAVVPEFLNESVWVGHDFFTADNADVADGKKGDSVF